MTDKEQVFSAVAPEGGAVSREQVAGVVCPAADYVGKRVLLIVPDGTRTAPIGLIFKMLFEQISGATRKVDVMIALGTHQPMSEAAICARLDISPEDRRGLYRDVEFINHEWDNPAALRQIGTITKDDEGRIGLGCWHAVSVAARAASSRR